MTSKMPNQGNIYLIEDTYSKLFKIGVTRGDVKNRLKKLQTGNGNKLSLIKTYTSNYPFKAEKLLHNRFREKKVLNEWFDLTKEDVDNFEQTCQEINQMINDLINNPFFWR